MTQIPSRVGRSPEPHLDEELLTAYVSTELPARECEDIERHLNGCDRCLNLLVVAHDRITLEAEVRTPVPAAVVDRVVGGRIPVTMPAARGGRVRDWLAAAGDRLAAFTRLPILVPASFAAGVALMLATQGAWLTQMPDRPITRSVNMHWTIRVTAPDAAVRAEPHARATIVGRVARGQVIVVNQEEREWYRAVLPSGTEGWIERQAFE